LLEAGRVVASGTHRDLLQRDPAYRRVLAAVLHIEELTT
jgi:ABC-type multidrug transport system fused ATPase/permease subunit